MTIRQAIDADVASIAALRRRWIEEDTGETIDDPDFEAGFATWWGREQSRRVFWVAELHTTVGFISLVEVDRMPQPGSPSSRWGYIGNAFVLPAQRDLGIGTRLLDAAVSYARDRGHVRVVLSPGEGAVPFYARAGFDTTDTLMLRKFA